MTTFDIDERFVPTTRPARRNILAGWFQAWRLSRRTRITLGELYRMDAYLLRDMGIEPQDVIDALEGRDTSLLFNPVRKPE
ncbi:DUF1127 domain-containing protein [Devosia ginsengisoli]|uniref:DUF1127 domain-containing protein n=1 Tax=Devosia ginsengisoli TaxID=400770 RepID=UPI0026F165D2|nr:DUF1127 domain-containing protein [Devosia ginsengisoli]MCR6671520.1 DUF1127 domain-containing protein [Devosia ginsengisoli]